MACAAFTPGAYATSVAALIDCRVEEMGRDGYLALAVSGSPVMIAIGGLLTILIGLVGYRLLLGDPFEIRDGVLVVVRIGIVLALATQWPAYQALVYNLVVRGPAELSDTLAGPIGGSSEAMVGRVQAAYDTLEALAHPARPQLAPAPSPAVPGAPAIVAPPIINPFPLTLDIEDQHRVSSAALVILVASLAGIVSVRLIAALLLALGPLFIACFLFRGLGGLFEGWVRGLAGAFLGSIAVTLVLSAELAVLEPQAAALAQALRAEVVPPGATGEIVATAWLFGLVMVALLLAAARVGAGFRLPEVTAIVQRVAGLHPAALAERQFMTAREPRPQPVIVATSRATQIVDALRMIEYRDAERGLSPSRLIASPSRDGAVEAPRQPLGQSHRRTLSRPSAAADRRDRAS